MLTPTTAPPPHISPDAHEQLTSRTPADFADIPPVLHFDGAAAIELASPNWTHWTGSDKVDGRLYVTEDAVTFLPASLSGFSLSFPELTLHALTPASADKPAHIYCQIDEGATTADGEDEEEYAQLSEMRIFVAPELLESLFGALSTCSALHDSLLPSGEPSSFFGFGGDDDEDDYEDEDDQDEHMANGSSTGRLRSALIATFNAPPAGSGPLHPAAHHSDEDDDDDGTGEKDAEVDAIAAFLSKVDWGSVPPPSGWVDVNTEDAYVAREELESARGRVAYLERLLKEERARVAELEDKVRVFDGEQFK